MNQFCMKSMVISRNSPCPCESEPYLQQQYKIYWCMHNWSRGCVCQDHNHAIVQQYNNVTIPHLISSAFSDWRLWIFYVYGIHIQEWSKNLKTVGAWLFVSVDGDYFNVSLFYDIHKWIISVYQYSFQRYILF